MIFLRFFLIGFALINFSFASDDLEWGDDFSDEKLEISQSKAQYPTEMSFENKRNYPVTIKVSKDSEDIEEIILGSKNSSAFNFENKPLEGFLFSFFNGEKLLFQMPVSNRCNWIVLEENSFTFGKLKSQDQ